MTNTQELKNMIDDVATVFNLIEEQMFNDIDSQFDYSEYDTKERVLEIIADAMNTLRIDVINRLLK